MGYESVHRELDWWKRDGERGVENWAFVDMIRVYRQLNRDLFERP